jgi:aminopeptidase N
MPCTLALLLPALAPLLAPQGPAPADPRTRYDVEVYELDLRVDPLKRRIEGTVGVQARVLADGLGELVLDCGEELEVREVRANPGPLEEFDARPPAALAFRREGARLACRLPQPAPAGTSLSVTVGYTARPGAANAFDGFHWERTPDGRPWVATSYQGLGAHNWWPCKASWFHPEDKPERIAVDLTVPPGLYAVSNGRLLERSIGADGWETFRWRHDYPLETYAVTLNVAPYVVIEQPLELEGLDAPVPMAWYVLPSDEDKARLQFAELPAVLEAFGAAFGPWPFPRSKVALVQTPFWGMEHSTAIAYGSSFPAWIALNGGDDPYAPRNRWFDFILVHEAAHEWWGNAVSAADWGDFWLHEGFATYAEGVFVERRDGREAADRFFAQMRRSVPRRGALYRGRGATSGEAYSPILYGKGGLVLNTLRHYVDDDEAWWRALRTFNLRFRYSNATTEDFQAVLEEATGREWGRFFAEWVHGSGWPRVRGSVRRGGPGLLVEIANDPPAPAGFQVPLDLIWIEDEQPRSRRLWLEPGESRLEVACEAPPRDVRVAHLERVLGKHDVRVE